MHFFTLALVACATFSVSIADVSHLVKNYIPPSPVMQLSPAAMTIKNPKNGQSNGERVVTTIEQQELQELPTQIEYLQPGQMPYGFEVTEAKPNNIDETKTVKLMMPLHPSSSLPPIPTMVEKPATLKQNITSLSPAVNRSPVIQNDLPMLSESQRNPEMSAANALSLTQAPSMVMRAQNPESAPSTQYLTPKQQNSQDKISHNPAMHTPRKQFFVPMSSHQEQELQEQSAPAPQYLPPQQLPLNMPPSQYRPPQFLKYEIQQQSQHMPPTAYYLPTPTNTLKLRPAQREIISQFGEVENVAEAAQEAIEMFDGQRSHQPMPSPNVEAPAYNFEYLPPKLYKTQNIAFSPLNHQQQSMQMPPVDFLSQHKQLMMMQGDVAPMSLTQFHVSSADSNLPMAPYPMQAHLLSSDGYHYHNAGNTNELNSGDNAVKRFRARQ